MRVLRGNFCNCTFFINKLELAMLFTTTRALCTISEKLQLIMERVVNYDPQQLFLQRKSTQIYYPRH